MVCPLLSIDNSLQAHCPPASPSIAPLTCRRGRVPKTAGALSKVSWEGKEHCQGAEFLASRTKGTAWLPLSCCHHRGWEWPEQWQIDARASCIHGAVRKCTFNYLNSEQRPSRGAASAATCLFCAALSGYAALTAGSPLYLTGCTPACRGACNRHSASRTASTWRPGRVWSMRASRHMHGISC